MKKKIISTCILICVLLTFTLASSYADNINFLEEMKNTRDNVLTSYELNPLAGSMYSILKYIIAALIVIKLIFTGLEMKDIEDSTQLARIKKKITFQFIGLLITLNIKSVIIFLIDILDLGF